MTTTPENLLARRIEAQQAAFDLAYESLSKLKALEEKLTTKIFKSAGEMAQVIESLQRTADNAGDSLDSLYRDQDMSHHYHCKTCGNWLSSSYEFGLCPRCGEDKKWREIGI
jgi:rubrerythrin